MSETRYCVHCKHFAVTGKFIKSEACGNNTDLVTGERYEKPARVRRADPIDACGPEGRMHEEKS